MCSAKRYSPAPVPANEEKRDDSEKEDASWGSDEFFEYYETYDEDIFRRENVQTVSGLVIVLLEKPR